jgi:hypothetical protein
LLIKQKTQLSNQLGFLIYQSHPELASFCKQGIPEWVLQLIKKYPTAAELASARVSSVGKIPYVTFEKATNLISNAKSSVASCTTETDAAVMKATVEQIITLDRIIEEHKKMLVANSSMSEIKLLTTIPGIGEYSAVGLMTNIISIKRFANPKKLASFFGIHPVFKESGDGRSVPRMSKRGHSQPRAILYMNVLAGLNCNPVIKKIYERSVRNGMAHQAAIGVCMHKMLRIIYGILVTGKSFDAMVDELNQKRKMVGRPKLMVDKKRRFQLPDPTAPVSGRQHRERTEKKRGKIKPHMNSVHKCGVIDSLSDDKNNISTGHKNTQIKTGLVPIKTILQAVFEEV